LGFCCGCATTPRTLLVGKVAAPDPSWKIGIRLMIKLVFSLRRRQDLSREEFQAYWRDQHAPLVARHAEVLQIRRYVQTHARASEVAAAQSAARGSEPDAYDGQAELWWDSLEDLVAAASAPEGQQAALDLLEDERRFIDLEHSPLWIGEEHLVTGAASD
jgi:uncharacterized protein (TIGR02118 family)